MKMKAHHRKCFLFWALIRMIFTCIGICLAQDVPFRVQDSKLSATEGSCAEIRCNAVTPLSDRNAKWFWMKDAVWDQKERDYVNITYVYSTDQQDVSADFAARVKYIGTGPPWYGRQTCSIQICNLKKTDSGNYRFRFVGTGTHICSTEDATLTVRENQCPMTFTGPPVVKEFQTISLSCSTLPSCPSYPQIQGLRAPESTTLQEYTNDKKISNATFEATWQDDGKEFRCQAPDNTDQHLVKKFTLTVEYAPKDVEATVNPTAIIEGQRVTLTCSAKGHPAPTFTWFKNETKQSNQEAQWTIPQVETWHGGSYHCEARNKHGAVKSQSVDIDVTYRPEVEIKRTSPVSEAKEGDEMILECQVKRSHPMPSTYRWYKDNKILDHSGPQYRKTIVQTDGGVYKCAAENTAGSSGFLNPILIHVQYGPRKPSIHPIPNQVKVGGSLEIFCDTTAEPAPTFYTWYRHTRGTHANTSVYGSHTEKYLSLTGLKRGDEACYTCSATNIIKTGESSEEACVEVLYPPTNLQLLMDPEVQEHQLVNISCTVESWPPSQLTLRAERSSAPLPSPTLRSNVLNYTFTATPAHRGTYTCSASNGEGSSQTTQWDLVVRYGPRDVKIQAPAGLTGNENSGLTLLCSASAYPEASFTWWKVAPRAPEELRRNRTLAFDSLRASDSGQYKCSASNDIGTRESELAEVKVKYAPKLTVISRVAEQQQQPDGRSSVRLSCSSHCYPPVLHYSWFKRATDEPGDKGIRVYSYQNVTVYSDKPGYYYCKARNEMGERSSDSEPLFVEGGFMKALKYGLLFLFIVILLIIVIGIYRWRRSKPVQRSSKTTTLRFGFLSGNNARTRLREPAHNSHSGDEMSYSQPTPQHPHRRPNVAPASELIVYSRVNLPTTNPGTAAQKATRQGDSNTMEGSLQYASLQFDKRKKTQEPKAEDNVVYAKVAKRKVVENHGDDYTNVGGAPALRPNVYSWDSDTSEEETALNYAQVSFPAKAEHERTRKDSSSSEKEETNYSEVKF